MSDAPKQDANGKALQIVAVQKDVEFIRVVVTEIKAELVALREWRNQTDARLATGTERFDQHASEIEKLRGRDTTVGVVGALITAVGSFVAAALGMQK